MADVSTLASSGPTDAGQGGSTWAGAAGTPATTAIATMLETDATATSTNGVDSLTITVQETGLYLMSGYILVTQASDAATSHALRLVYDYNDSVSTRYLGGTDLDATSLNAVRSEHFTGLCVKGTVATVSILNAIVGAKTVGVGKYKLAFAITKL
jgi:hypothetical protein